MHEINIMRSGSLVATIFPEDSSSQVKRIMGDNVINISFAEDRLIPFDIGDYCTVFGEVYKLNTKPIRNKISENYYEYTLEMQSEAYDLSKAYYLFLDSDNSLTNPVGGHMTDASGYIDLIIQNMARIDTGWTKGQVIPTEAKPFNWVNLTCYQALSEIAKLFETEYWIEGKKIHLTKVQRDTGRLFQHGEGKGLYEILERNQDNSNISTRLYVYGSEKNLPHTYNGNRLRLPITATNGDGYKVQNVAWTVTDNGNGTETISFSFDPPTGPNITTLGIFYKGGNINSSSHGGNFSPRSINVNSGATYEIEFVTYLTDNSSYRTDKFQVTTGSGIALETPGVRIPYLERNTQQYGILESIQIFEDIYPRRTGSVSGVDATDIYEFSDSSIDFDINNYSLPGTRAKVTFNSGQLAGYTFDITKYNHATRTITILKNKDEKSIDVPSSLLKPEIGDKYVLVDIIMPESYVQAAEAELLVKAQKLLEVLSIPQVNYTITIDPTFLEYKKYEPQIFDMIWIKDAEFNLNRKIRIVSTTRNIVKELDYKVELADTVSVGTIERLTNTGNDNSQGIRNIEDFINNRDVLNGKMQLPTISDTTDYQQVYIHKQTGQLARKV